MDLLVSNMWWVMALVSSVFAATFFTSNQYFKMPSVTLVFWRGLIPFLAITPVLFFIDWVENPYFYVIVGLSGFVALFSDAWKVRGSARYGGGITTRMEPFDIWLVFIAWLAMDSVHRMELFQQPIKFTGIMVVFAVATIAVNILKKCDISKEAIVYFIPAILAGAALSLVNKTAMDMSALASGVFIYSWIQGLVISSTSLIIHAVRKDMSVSDLFKGKLLLAGLFMGFIMLLANLTKNVAMSFTENPAYVVAIISTAPFWVSVFYKLTGHEEKADVRTGLIFVLSAMALVLLNSL
jgi:hypothetical protein